MSANHPADPQQVFHRLRALRTAPHDEAYWGELCVCLALLCRARSAVALRRDPDGAWHLLGHHPGEGRASIDSLIANLNELAPRALAQGHAYAPDVQGHLVAAVTLHDPEGITLALLEIPARERGTINDLLVRAQLVADLPSTPQAAASVPPEASTSAAPASTAPASTALVPRAAQELAGWVDLVDLVARVMKESRFGAASLALVNLLAAQLRCDQVVLGVSERAQVRVEAISHIDRFEQRAENVQLLQAALEEALDQHGDLVFPQPSDSSTISLAHDRLARIMGLSQLATLVLPEDAQHHRPAMALLLGRRDEPLAPAMLHQVSVSMHLLHPWLSTLRERSQGTLKRAALRIGRGTLDAVSPEYPGRKLLALAVLVFAVAVSVVRWPFRIEAPAELITDSVQIVSAPFEGYLRQVRANLGDAVRAGTLLASLDTRELRLQAADLDAEVARYDSEADRARAQAQTAETQIALARAAQARARLQRVRFQLSQAEILAPFDGVVVEGERKELTGAPVRQGDKLFRVARVESLYAVVHVSERDVRALPPDARGSLRLLSQPEREIAFQAHTLVPIAQVHGAQGGQFQLKVRLDQVSEPWWRPGMTGLARIDAGERPIIWIWTHRLIDTLRLKLWW